MIYYNLFYNNGAVYKARSSNIEVLNVGKITHINILKIIYVERIYTRRAAAFRNKQTVEK